MDRTFGLWFIVWVLIRCCGWTHEVQFYQGCINATGSGKLFANESHSEPFSCVGLCSRERYTFAAIQNGSLCVCHSAINTWTNESECNIRCASSSALQCGGTNSQSVYSTAVPFIDSASLTPCFQSVPVNTTLTFDFSVLMRRPANEVIGLESLQSNNESLNNIYINWKINDNHPEFSNHSLIGNITLSSMNISLHIPGSFKICASAKNLVSRVKKCHVLDVLLPVSGLHMVDINPKAQMLLEGRLNVSVMFTNTPLFIKTAIRKGSNVTFLVSFGGNTSFAVGLTSTRYDTLSVGPTCVTVWHAYTHCGNYSVRVSAFNAFSNQSLPAIPVIVQEKIKHASVDSVGGVPGSLVKLKVVVLPHPGGCELTYNWTFGDGSPFVTSQVPSVLHIFNETNMYLIQVDIYNSFGRQYKASGVAYIQTKLTNVTISITSPLSSSKNIYETGTIMNFLAHTQPDPEKENAKYMYVWFINDEKQTGTLPSHRKKFRDAGSFLAYVVAKNKVSNVTSKPIAIIIEEPIVELKLKLVSEKIAPHEKIIFQASMILGTNVMAIWDFGDGTVLTTNRTQVSHVYTNEKVYDVEVMVYNNVSQENASLATVITRDGSCQPPTVQILRWPRIRVNRFAEVYFESEVTFNCNFSNDAVVYQWKIYQRPNMKKLNNITSYVNEPTLIIPPYTLPYKKHVVELRVHNEGTPELYSKAVVEIKVERANLVANIKGGSMRVVGYQNIKQNVTLDGSSSFDPDYPGEEDLLSFKWDCHPLSDPEASCFDPEFNLSLNQPNLTFPVQWLQPGKSRFYVGLTVSKQHRKSKAWQIIRMVNDEPHLLTVDCPQCEQKMVNPSDPLVLQSSCLTCPWDNKNLTFKWELYLISSDDALRPNPLPEPCVSSATESVNKQRVAPTTSSKRFTVNLPTTRWYPSRRFIGYPARGTSRLTTVINYKPTRPNEGLAKNQGFRVEKGDVCDGLINTDPKVTPTSRCKYFRKPSNGYGFRRQPTGQAGFWTCPPDTTPPVGFKTNSSGYGSGRVAVTQHPSGSGTGPPRSPVLTLKGYPTAKPGITSPVIPTAPTVHPSDGSSTGILYEPGYVAPAAHYQPTLLSIQRQEIKFPDSWSKTGHKERAFVLLPGKLSAGYTYMLALNVKDKFKTNHEHRRGMANVFFKVNKNPTIGGCSFEPMSGYEMETVFGIGCTHGIVQAELNYQVTCKIQGDQEDESILLYTGLNDRPTFMLPAGRREHGYNVSVYISVFNSKRTTLKVCPFNAIVRPSKYGSSEDLLINKTLERMQAFIKVGEEQKVKQLVQILTKRLNRFNFSIKHQQIRTTMLEIIKKFRVRDEASAIQSGEALDTITSADNEVEVEGLKIASEILSKVAIKIQQARPMNKVDYCERLVYLVTKLSSNVLSASSYLFTNISKSARSTQVQELIQRVIFQVLQLVIKTKLDNLMVGEKPVRLLHPSLGVLISKSLSVPQSVLELQNVSFRLPSNMAKYLGMNSKSYSSACLGTVMVVYEKSPYVWNNNQSLHKSKVSSLDLTSCHGDIKVVKNLSQEIEMDLPWVEYKDDDQESSYSVKWRHLNVHTIDINNEMRSHSLQLKIKTLTELTDSLRLKVLVSTKENERSLQNSRIFKSSTGGSVEFFFTPKQLINSSGTLRVGVIIEDSAQNRIKKIIKVSPVNYSFSSLWIGCFYWDKPRGNWSTQGCHATEKTSQFNVNCRCNHLTSFSAAALLAPNRLKEINLRDIASGDNVVALSLVVSIVLLYIVLIIFCVRADKQDRRKKGLVDLSNTPCRNPHKYKIMVETGHWFGSGTTADVMIRLHGENATSDAIKLVGNGKLLFQRGSMDAFLIKSPCDLSPLWKVHVWHYNQGTSPSWYLNRVIVKDMATKEKWYFDCYRWLAVDQEDGRIDLELVANSGSKENNLQCFYHSCVQYLLDYHLWLSVAGKPPRSRFTHAQRMTCCLSLIMSTLCVSAAWYKTENSNTMPLQLLGFLDMTWNTVVFGIVCSLIALPINLVWMLLFRYSQPSGQKRKVQPSPIDDPITDTTCLPINTVAPEEDNLSLLDQTIETLLYLKSLGNKIPRFQPSYISERSSLDSSFATNSLDDEVSYTSEPLKHEKQASKEAPWTNKPEGADIESNNKDQPCSSCSSGSLPPSEARHDARECYHLSFYFVFVGWAGCVATISSGAFFTMWYGASFGKEKSYRWLQSLFISFLESLFISQPVMVLAFFLYTLLSIYRTANKKNESSDEDQDEGFQELPSCYFNMGFDQTHDTLKEALEIKRHQRYLKFLKPLGKSTLTDSREKKERERATNSYFRDFFFSFTLLLLVCLLVSGLYCGCAFDMQNAVQKSILRQSSDENNLPYRTIEQWWKENHERIVEVLYWRPIKWNSKNTTAPEVYLKESQSVLVGRIRIRQFKALERQKCRTNASDTRVPGGQNSSLLCGWTGTLDQSRWSSVELSRTKLEARETVRRLSSLGWVSIYTQQISIEFVIYSPSQDVFSAVTWKAVGQLSGVPKINIQVQTFRGTLKDTSYDVFLKVCKVLFIITYLLCLYYELSSLMMMKKKYLQSVEKYMTMFCLLLMSLSVIVYIYWSVSTYNLFREVLTKLDDDVYSAGTLVYRNQELLLALYSLLIFILVLKFVHLLTVFKFVQRFCHLLSATSWQLIGLLVFFVIFVLTFSHTGHLIFGRINSNFKTFSRSFIFASGFLRLVGQGHFVEAFYLDRPVFSILYLALYIAGLFVVLRGLSVSILRASYHSSKRRHLSAHLVTDYLFELYNRLCKAKNIEDDYFESDDDDIDDIEDTDGKQIIPVEYACDEVEFQIEELLFKLDNLAGTVGLKANKLTYSSDILSGDEGDEDVEYIYRAGYPGTDLEFGGSGYESDQSFFSYGSANQEGLTDLEKERKISKDSSTLTISETSSFVQHRTLVKPESPKMKSAALQITTLTPKQLYRRNSDNSAMYSTELKVQPRSIQSSSGTSMSSRRPSLTKEFTKPKHLYPLTRKPKIRDGQMLLPESTQEYEESAMANVDDSTTSEEHEDRKSGKAKSRSSKKYNYRRALGLLPKTSVAPMSDDTNPPDKHHHEAFRSISSLPSQSISYNRRSSSSSEDTPINVPTHVCRGNTLDDNQPKDELDNIPPLSPSEPGFGVHSQGFFGAQDNLGFLVDAETYPPGLIQNIWMNAEIGTSIVSVCDEDEGQKRIRSMRAHSNS